MSTLPVRYSDALRARLAADEQVAAAVSLAARVAAEPTPTSDEAAATLADSGKVCRDMHKLVKARLDEALAPLLSDESDTRAVAAPLLEALDSAVKAAKKRLDEWMAEKERKEAEARRERERLEAEERARVAREQAEADRVRREEEARVARETAAAAQIAAEGQLPVPEVKPAVVPEVRPMTLPEPAPAAPAGQVRGGLGVASRRKNPPKVLLLDAAALAKVHPEWLTLNEAAAKAGFKDEAARQLMKIVHATGSTPDVDAGEPAAVEAFAAMGVRVWFESGVSFR